VVDRVALGQVLSEYFGYPCHSFITLIAPQCVRLKFPLRRLWWIPSSGMWRRLALVRTDFSKERIASIIRAGVLRLLVPKSQILVTSMMEAVRSSETSTLTRATQRHIPEDGILEHVCAESCVQQAHSSFSSLSSAPAMRVGCPKSSLSDDKRVTSRFLPAVLERPVLLYWNFLFFVARFILLLAAFFSKSSVNLFF
jgi:hypothetical protein